MAEHKRFPTSGKKQTTRGKLRSGGFERTITTTIGKRKRIKKK